MDTLIALVIKHKLISFFTLTYFITWSITLYSIFVSVIPSNSFFWYFSIFGPTISAIIITLISDGTNGLKKLLSGFLRWNVGWKWYLAAISLTLMPLIIVVIYTVLGNPVKGIDPKYSINFLLGNIIVTLLAGPLAEEAGWRGFALPRLQEKYSALVSSFILGGVWAFWHFPFYYDSAGAVGIPFPIYFVLITILTIFFTWIYNNSKGSLIITVLAHFCFNFNSAFLVGYLGLMPAMPFYIMSSIGLVTYIVLIIIIAGPKHLSRKPINSLNYLTA